MRTKKIVIALSLLSLSALLNPAAMATEATDVSNILAAKTMRARMQEQQQLLEHYQDKSYLYGRQAQDLQAHTDALARKYEEAIKSDTPETKRHHQMASQAEENSRSSIE